MTDTSKPTPDRPRARIYKFDLTTYRATQAAKAATKPAKPVKTKQRGS